MTELEKHHRDVEALRPYIASLILNELDDILHMGKPNTDVKNLNYCKGYDNATNLVKTHLRKLAKITPL